MFLHFLRTAFRSIRFRPLYFLVQLLGLATGLTLLAFSFFYLRWEQGYDEQFVDADRIFRLEVTRTTGNGDPGRLAAGPVGVGPEVALEYAEVESHTLLMKAYCILRTGDKVFTEEHAYLATPGFFPVFGINLMAGDAATALARSNTIVLSRSLARKYFGDEWPIGKTMEFLGFMELEVTGVYEDFPVNAHFHPELLISMETYLMRKPAAFRTSWFEDGFYTYLKLTSAEAAAALEPKLASFTEARQGGQMKKTGQHMSFSLRPVLDIHLYSDQLNEHESNGNGRWLAWLFIASLFVLFMVTVNYINLQVGKAMESGREVVVNRMFGATRWQFYLRFLAEAWMCIFPATLLAAALTWGLFPEFTAWLGWTVTEKMFFQPTSRWMILLVPLALLLCSPVYPSLSLAGRSLASGMKGTVTYSRAGMTLRRTLVGVQFFICLILFIGSAGMYAQMKFMTALPKGFDERDLLAVSAPGLADSLFAARHQTFVAELNRLPGVKGVTTSTEIPGKQVSWAIYHLRDARTAGKEGERITVLAVDDGFIRLMGMKLLAGRDFQPWVDGQRKEVLLNRKAMQVLGYTALEEVPGRTIVNERDTFLVRGVVEDFRQEFSGRPMEPLMLMNNPLRCNYYFIRHAGTDVPGLLIRVRDTWDKTFPLNPFNHYVVESIYQEQFMPDLRQERVIELFTLITLLISSIGLFGLSAYITAQRRREVAIRKVLGASATGNLWLLSKEFFTILAIASVTAIGPSWWLLNDWRSGFPVRPPLSPLLFLIPVIVLMITGLLSIGWNVIRAMRVPVAEVLRYE